MSNPWIVAEAFLLGMLVGMWLIVLSERALRNAAIKPADGAKERGGE